MTTSALSAFNTCLRNLSIAVSTANLYGLDHNQIKRLCKNAHKALAEAFSFSSDISLIRLDDQLAINGHPLPSSIYIGRFARYMQISGVGHIKFLPAIEPEELHQLVSALVKKTGLINSSVNVRLGQVEVRKSSASKLSQGQLQKAKQILSGNSSEELAKLMDIYTDAQNHRQLHVAGLSEIVSEFIDIFASYAEPMLTLVPLRSMDEYTFTHSLNVCMLNLAQATSLGLSGPLLHDIGLSAMLHDVGKLFVPQEILNKPGRLSSEEKDLMEAHPERGAEYLLNTPGVPRMAVINAYEHHLRYDLSGYPKVNSKWNQNICSQMTTISDVYDALRTKRPYRSPLNAEDVLGIISELDGSQLHPVLTENFLRLMKKVDTP
ncbi:MAG: HD domain-containing protein [Deltaproteobacteria bacterium]|jgi:HD-GYP domain-containing protein (c-di-GMP phosphodiesterase class II)|nr:HD domain-containing protein [Deltaproteobacteria bacterium]